MGGPDDMITSDSSLICQHQAMARPLILDGFQDLRVARAAVMIQTQCL